MPNPKRIIPVSEVKPGDSVQIGGDFTNRKAKRARGKMARRERFDVRSKAALDQFRAGGAEARRVLQAQSDRLASSVSHAEDAAIIRHTRIAGRSPGKT